MTKLKRQKVRKGGGDEDEGGKNRSDGTSAFHLLSHPCLPHLFYTSSPLNLNPIPVGWIPLPLTSTSRCWVTMPSHANPHTIGSSFLDNTHKSTESWSDKSSNTENIKQVQGFFIHLNAEDDKEKTVESFHDVEREEFSIKRDVNSKISCNWCEQTSPIRQAL